MPDKLPRLPTRQRPRLASVRIASGRRRRLSDKVRVAFHTACDEGSFDIAKLLLEQLGELVDRPPMLPAGVNRRQPESITGLCERLANLLLWRTEVAPAVDRSRLS